MESNKIIKSPFVKEFMIFSRDGKCIYHIDFEDLSINNKVLDVNVNKKLENRHKIIAGLLFSLKNFMKDIPEKQKDYLKSFSTSQYKLHFQEFINGIKFVIISIPTKVEYSGLLREMFKKYYTPLISYKLSVEPYDKNAIITNKLFDELVISYLSKVNF